MNVIGRRRLIRGVLILSILLSSLTVVAGYVTANEVRAQAVLGSAPPAPGPTVITGQGTPFLPSFIAVLDGNGNLAYLSQRYDQYYDVDPHPASRWDFYYSATRFVQNSKCSERRCYRYFLVFENYSTGDSMEVVTGVGGDIHDIDHSSGDRFLVADIRSDSVYEINIRTGKTDRHWSARWRYDPFESGGRYPDDWTHLNDVEVLDDGRVMVSLRNHDQIVFIENGSVDEDWTLGSDDEHDILFEQHNPDYIPPENGGPAVLIADSENDRIIEYQREDGAWTRSWVWSDSRLSWGRDADRLPNGNTLVSDSHGGRILEVAPNGSIVWQTTAPNPYDAERLTTGAESEGGPSAASIGLASKTVATDYQSAGRSVVGLFPSPLVHAVQFITPNWVGFIEVAALGMALGSFSVLVVLELYWRQYRVRWPVYLDDSG